jgi:alkylation response protein AidB-like acyl-CoA dehydrogenase
MDSEKANARAAVRLAQEEFERETAEIDAARQRAKATRREAFQRARDAGLTAREIAEAANGMHHSSVLEILSGK